jgi:hypothetical protein
LGADCLPPPALTSLPYFVRFSPLNYLARVLRREMQKSPLFTEKKGRASIFCGLALFLAVCFEGAGCTVKRTVEIQVDPKITAAKNATLKELIDIAGKYGEIFDLKCVISKIFLTTGKWESGKQEEFKGAPGYILLRRPDLLHLVLQNPVLTKSAIFEIVSTGDDFSAWLRNKNKIYKGKNSASELFAEDLPNGIPLRPPHIFEAILPIKIDTSAVDARVSVEETADKTAKYYILSVYKEGIPPRIHTIRKIWIERSQLVISRQQIFELDGRMICDIEYEDMEAIGGFFLPGAISLNRPEDGYSLKMEFNKNTWKINSKIEEDAFILTPREGAETVYFTDHK